MNKSKINYIVDVLSAIAFLSTALSGLVIYFFLPSGVKRGGYQEFLGITKHSWVDFHNFFGLFFIALALVHIFLHWQWLVAMTKNIFSAAGKKNNQEGLTDEKSK